MLHHLGVEEDAMRITTNAKRFFYGFAAKQTSEIALVMNVTGDLCLHLLQVLEGWMFRWSGASGSERLVHAVCAKSLPACHRACSPNPYGSDPSQWTSRNLSRSSDRLRGGISQFR
jgi:hypothetical protein